MNNRKVERDLFIAIAALNRAQHAGGIDDPDFMERFVLCGKAVIEIDRVVKTLGIVVPCNVYPSFQEIEDEYADLTEA